MQAVDRAISVLEILAREGDGGVSEVATELGVHKSTAFRLLNALERRGLVEQSQDRGRYRLGFGVVRLAGAVSGGLEITRRGRPVCERLAGELGETVNIAVAQARYAVNLDQVGGGCADWVGLLTPLHATSSGKVLLAHRTARRRAELMSRDMRRFTRNTITTGHQLAEHLETVQRRGYAVTVEEYEVGLNAVAAPVRDPEGNVFAALSASGPAHRLTETVLHERATTLIDGADEISDRLGFPG
ncbi:IclR family transcriptional regulator [Actinophytocola xinjiangensis]|uniref:Glycerol operon regulatory protein n=1 Tax=Actinophytocola xinjiangensis TaxID=485602 RepID=A0A7Z1AX13_9PSEU|nr:IclR family transcriptional regulator [Actinophytocola xinjiangensis]